MPYPTAAIIRNVRLRSEPFTVSRRDDTTSGSYGESISYTELNAPREILVSGMEESQQPTDAGENQSKRMTFYAVPSVDLQVNDRIEYAGQTYEVLAKTGHPSETDPSVYRYELDDV